MKTVYKLLAISFISISATCSAFTDSTAEITWTPPTERVNGEPLDPTKDIQTYTVYCRENLENEENPEWPDTGYEIEGFVENGYHETDYTNLVPKTGSYECSMTSTDTNGLESKKGGTDTVDFYVPPNSPRNLNLDF